ncbi:hypothetical protein PVAND_013833 [Polypedilum vanderplanki]|uniref:Tyrosine aminotransferase n=1 Tax=Polypedilum vanderplanki TaxID=319348 RepID=A0A9J6CRP5_POLVA|nr:hypothetical protein PVAND_013833 [Polypedilum vanderplanki]
MTTFAEKTDNPLRKIWEGPKIDPNKDKKLITLQIGDPTAFGNFYAAKESIEAIKNALEKDNFSYTVSSGLKAAREAVASYVNNNDKSVQVNDSDKCFDVNSEDVIMSNGCSTALEICFRALANPRENILVPRPSWNYSTWLEPTEIVSKFYNLDCTRNWEIDLEHLESQIDESTRAILVNNPGNPCGNVFSKEHILKILEIAEKHQIPIIADEVYEFFTFPGIEFYSFSSLSKNVPILTCSGLTKRFIMPGIRVGWIVIHDRNNQLNDIRKGLLNIAGRNFWPNSTAQIALTEIIKNTPKAFLEENAARVHDHALSAYKILRETPGLIPIFPRGGMYIMIKIELEKFPKFKTCLEFTQQLIREQSVATFPGYPCFNFPGFFRIVLTVPKELIIEACERIKEFCEQNCKQSEKYLKSG